MNEDLIRRALSMPMGPTRKSILVALACHADQMGEVQKDIDLERLAALTCVTVSAARAALAWLIYSGYVEQKVRPHLLRVTGAGGGV